MKTNKKDIKKELKDLRETIKYAIQYDKRVLNKMKVVENMLTPMKIKHKVSKSTIDNLEMQLENLVDVKERTIENIKELEKKERDLKGLK